MDTKTLEERIRANARQKLKKEIREELSSFRSKLHIGHSLPLSLTLPGGVTQVFEAHRVLDALENVIINYYGPKREDEAITKFLAKVDSLQAQIDELRIHDGPVVDAEYDEV